LADAKKTAEGFHVGERIVRTSMLTLLGTGVVEMLVGVITGSLGLTADGIDSFSDAVVSLFVWIGLHFARKRPDQRFHFGYYRVETLSALFMSMGMMAVSGLIFYEAYQRLLHPVDVKYAPLALVTVFIAGVISLYRAIQMRTVAKKYNILSLHTNASNSIKDSSSSFVIFGSVVGVALGIKILDAIGGIIVATYLLTIAYTTMKEASLILMDATQSPELVEVLVDELDKLEGILGVDNVKLRMTGPYITGVITLLVNPKTMLEETVTMRQSVLETITRIMEPVGDIHIEFMPAKTG